MKKRIVIIALVVALVATCFGGTLAYLTDTDEQTNTFTTGKVLINLDEAKIDGTGRTTEDQNYKLFPGQSYTKDPTITVDEDSEDAWVAAKITFSGYYAYDLLSGGVLGTNAVTEKKDGNVVYVYVNDIKSAKASIVLFEELTVPAAWNNAEMATLNNMKIDVEAYAVQAEGFGSCQEAMATAFSGTFPAIP